MLTWYKKAEAKTASTNFTWLSADLPFTYTGIFWVSRNSNLIPPSFIAFHNPLIFAW